jgi:hypothetical protein
LVYISLIDLVGYTTDLVSDLLGGKNGSQLLIING